MLMHCEKCRQETDINYSESDDMAVCSQCGGKFGISPYQKKMLIETKSVIKDDARTGFMYACMNCSTEREVRLKGEDAHCAVCDAKMNLPPAMLQGLKTRKNFVDVGDSATDRPSFSSGMGRKKPKKADKKPKRRGRPKKKGAGVVIENVNEEAEKNVDVEKMAVVGDANENVDGNSDWDVDIDVDEEV